MIRLAAALVFAIASHAQAAGGDLDTTLGNAGISPIIDTTNDPFLVFARASDGKFIVVRNTQDSVIVQRRLANGTLDASFGSAGQVTHRRAGPVGSPVPVVPLAVKGILFQGTKILLAGEATSACGTPGIARLNANGSVDINFAGRGWSTPVPATRGKASCNLGTEMSLPEFRLLDDGRIMLVAAPFTIDFMQPFDGEQIVVRWTANGELDTGYAEAGFVRGFPWRQQPGGVRVMGDGSVRMVRSEPEGVVAGSLRFRAFGVVISPGGTVSQAALAVPQELAGGVMGGVVQLDGSILLFNGPQFTRLVVAKFRRSGSAEVAVSSYGTSGVARIDIGHVTNIRSALATPDGGTLFLMDSENAVIDGLNDAIVLLKLDEIGVREPSFGRNGRVDFSTSPLTEFPFQAAIEPDGYLGLFAYSTFRSGTEQRYGFYYARIQAVPDIVEFENATLRHYFIGYDNAEARGIDRGAAGAGWSRTPQAFRPGGPTPVCRFYARGPNSHFYTADADECAQVKRDPGWTYEGLSFSVTLPVDGFCPTTLRPVHRVYNNRFAQNDSNHRFLVNETFIQSMVATGWVYEGIVFCVPK